MSDPLALSQRPKKSKTRKILLALAIFVGLAGLACVAWYRYTFPYGYSHACSAGLGLTLSMYAGEHRDWLPHGEATPEASLSLLYKYDPSTLSYFGGKSISTDTVEAALKHDGLLSPKTCGWHYIEGLRDSDDPQIAVAWDKTIGLGHNGERVPGMMHEVILLGAGHRYVSKQDWPEFITDQKKRLEGVIKSRDSNDPPIRWSDEESLGPNRPIPK